MHGDGFLRANAGLATAVLGGPTFPITECNKGNKGNKGECFKSRSGEVASINHSKRKMAVKPQHR